MAKVIPVQVRLDEKLRRLLAVVAAERGVSQSEVVAELLRTLEKRRAA